MARFSVRLRKHILLERVVYEYDTIEDVKRALIMGTLQGDPVIETITEGEMTITPLT